MNYEIMLILKPLLPEDIRTTLQTKVEDALTHGKGKITDTEVWGKRHLAYPINTHDEGYYLIYRFVTDPGRIPPIEGELNLMNDVLRHLITKTD